MGYDFAIDDKSIIEELDWLDARGRRWDKGDERRQELYEEELAVQRERYRLINLRREEMGQTPISEKELQGLDKSLEEVWNM